MTNTYYTLENGQTVKTYAEALKSGQKYTMCYEPVIAESIKVSNETRNKRINAIMGKRGNENV